MLRLVTAMQDNAAARREEARDSLVRELESRVAELQAALGAANDKVTVVTRV